MNKTENQKIKVGQLVKSKLDTHVNTLPTWRVLEITETLTGEIRYFCVAAHDTKSSYGFDSIKHDFKYSELELNY